MRYGTCANEMCLTCECCVHLQRKLTHLCACVCTTLYLMKHVGRVVSVVSCVRLTRLLTQTHAHTYTYIHTHTPHTRSRHTHAHTPSQTYTQHTHPHPRRILSKIHPLLPLALALSLSLSLSLSLYSFCSLFTLPRSLLSTSFSLVVAEYSRLAAPPPTPR